MDVASKRTSIGAGQGWASYLVAGDILEEACAVEERIYLLFPAGLRITLFAQQVRALSLVDEIRTHPWIANYTRIAVVGGGAAGMTAAAALKTAGLREELQVTLFESADQIMPLQSGCHDKLLTPHLIDWPAATATATHAGLPVLDWRQSTAAAVALDLIAQFERFNVVVETMTTVKEINQDGQRVKLAIERAGLQAERWFDMVIVAAGFGLEAKPDGIENATTPYWRVHPDQAPRIGTQEKPEKILISGLGDGGLIDFVLFACPGLSHPTLCDRLSNSPDAQRLTIELERIEEEVWVNPPTISDIEAAYGAMEIDALARNLILPFLVRDVDFTLMTRGNQLFGRGTAPLNRLAAMIVIRATELDNRGTTVHRLLNTQHLPDEAGATVYSVGGDRHSETFDLVVVRHGDTSDATWEFGNQAISEKVADLRARRAAIVDRPQTPTPAPDLLARIDARFLGTLTTRLRLTRRGDGVLWQGDIGADDVGRLWRAQSAPIQISIDFAPDDEPGRLDFAICRLLAHAEPRAQIGGAHTAVWIEFMGGVARNAGDRTRAATLQLGSVAPNRNEFTGDPDVLAEKLESAMDQGLLALLDDRIRSSSGDPPMCLVGLHQEILAQVVAGWVVWLAEVRRLSANHRRWVLQLSGGLLNKFGQPDPWSAVRVGPKCVEDEILPAVVFHLVMRSLLEGFGAPAKQPTGNVLRHAEDATSLSAAHFCGSRFFRSDKGDATPIDAWERNWPGEQWVPSCLVLPARKRHFLPERTLLEERPSGRMLAPAWARTPIIFASAELDHALRSGATETISLFKAALHDALPEI